MKNRFIVNLAAIVLMTPLSPLVAEKTDGQSLDQAANDPTASLMSVQIQTLYSGDYYNLSAEDSSAVLLRSAVPFTTGSLKHIARATLPIVTDNPSDETGLGDLVLFDLLAFDKTWGALGGLACWDVSHSQ